MTSKLASIQGVGAEHIKLSQAYQKVCIFTHNTLIDNVHGVFIFRFTDLECGNCVLQWKYISGNNWGKCKDGTSAQGCGPQEEFRGCSDVTIGRKMKLNFHLFRATNIILLFLQETILLSLP